MGPPENAQEFLQGMGRVVRLGQRFTPLILVLALNGSYDEYLMARSEKKMMSLIYSQRESTDFEESQSSALLAPHRKCYLGYGTDSEKANRLVNERIYQVNVGTPRTFFYRIKLKALHLSLNECGHPPENAKPEDYGITDQISSHKQTTSLEDGKEQSKRKPVVTSGTNSKRRAEPSDTHPDAPVAKQLKKGSIKASSPAGRVRPKRKSKK